MNKIRGRIARNVDIDLTTGCWNWIGNPRENGYCRSTFNRICEYVHRMSYKAFVGVIPDGLDIMHKCDNRRCCNPQHLIPGTRKQNMEDAVAKGRQAKGFMLPQTKLSGNDINEIVRRAASGELYKNIAKDFCVSKCIIGYHLIKKGVRRNGIIKPM